MKTNPGAAGTLVLLALAALLALLLGGARADAAGGERGACGPHTTPKITVNARQYSDGDYSKSYGEDIIINCSAKDTAKLGLKENGISLQSNQTNTTSIQFRVTTPNIGAYIYGCADSVTGCEASLVVLVKPAMSVESSRVQQRLEDGTSVYYVPLGDNYDVYCSANNVASLYIGYPINWVKQTHVVNGTTIKYTTNADVSGDSSYPCADSHENSVGNYIIVRVINFQVDYHFRCYIESSETGTIECSWTYPSRSYVNEAIVRYTLFYCPTTEGKEGYLAHDLDGEHVKLACENIRGEKNNTCKWDINLKKEFYVNNRDFSFVLMSCISTVCSNQTFLMNIYSITRLDSVDYVKVSNTGSQDVVLIWSNTGSVFVPVSFGRLLERVICESCSYVYKVEYRLIAFGDDWHATIASSVHCDDQRCKYRLVLPYPDAEYEVRVYTRSKQATDDRVWSDPMSTFVHTKPRVECPCERPDEPTTAVSFESASCDICTFAGDTINENLALKRKVNNLKQKLAKIEILKKYVQMGKELHDSD